MACYAPDVGHGEQVRGSTVDVVDDLLSIGPAVRAAITLGHTSVEVGAVTSSWAQYVTSIESVARCVIVRAELMDHVPTALKVRALRSAGARPVVVGNRPSPRHRARLLDVGAAAVLTRDHDLSDLLDCLDGSEPAVAAEPAIRPVLSQVRLSDRQLQLACLFAGRGAPSAEWLARWLGLPVSSVRTHLQRARRALGAANREQLRARLIEEGWMDAP